MADDQQQPARDTRPVMIPQTPPDAERGRGRKPIWDTPEVLATLRDNPGQWYLIGRGISNGFASVFRRHGFEAVTRNSKSYPSSRADVYARYNPTQEEDQ